ncbi:unnamed protein product [Blepharisma stoltei]|uniref:Uncharacterized protein n=1 Tax=Blepharisma stoltei TaxID=1481888 RepID=A0AAU9IW18_9CILI|nr:unnamed protein product [Blepharisma stoltei]
MPFKWYITTNRTISILFPQQLNNNLRNESKAACKVCLLNEEFSSTRQLQVQPSATSWSISKNTDSLSFSG